MKVGDLLKAVKKDTNSSGFSLPKELPNGSQKPRPISVQSQRTPTVFLAKKVNEEELFDDKEEKEIPKHNLDQILEEPPEIASKVSPGKSFSQGESESDEIEANPEEKGKNIFETEMLHSTKYQEHSKGPQFENGRVVKHSVVGPAEAFEKYQRKAQKGGGKGQDAETSFASNAESGIIASKNPRFSTLPSFQENPLPSLQTAGGPSNPAKRLLFESKRREFKKIPKVPKQELMLQIDEMKLRQQKFYNDIQKSVRSLKTGDMLYMTKEDRCLKKFDRTLDQWDKVVERTSSKLGRPASQSIASRGIEQRSKKEQAEVLEMMKSDEERFGGNFWKMTLRTEEGLTDRLGTEEDHFISSSRPQTGATTVRERPLTSVEVIRHPGIASGGDTWRTSFFRTGTSSATDRGKRAYMQEKVNKGWFKLDLVKANGDGIDQLVLNGENVLNAEIGAVFKNNEKSEYFPVILNKNKGNGEEGPKVIVENYDKRYVYNNGYNALTQFKFP